MRIELRLAWRENGGVELRAEPTLEFKLAPTHYECEQLGCPETEGRRNPYQFYEWYVRTHRGKRRSGGGCSMNVQWTTHRSVASGMVPSSPDLGSRESVSYKNFWKSKTTSRTPSALTPICDRACAKTVSSNGYQHVRHCEDSHRRHFPCSRNLLRRQPVKSSHGLQLFR